VRRALATTLAAGLILVACSGGDDDNELLDLQATEEPAPEETEEPEPEETEEPEPEDPYAVPDEIDEDYVERVINAILEVQAEVLRGALQQEQGENLSPDLTGLHFATTEGRQRTLGLEEYQGYIDDPSTRGGLFDELSNESQGRFTVDYVHHVEPDKCILALGYWDRTELSENAPSREDSLTAISLGRIPENEPVSEGNPTPWQWRHNLGLDGTITPDEWLELPWADELDHTCEELSNSEGDS
jgi:hypothetical protein